MCNNGELYLVDGYSDYEGRLEVCYNNIPGTVCDDLWTVQSTRVACRQLGIHDTTHGLFVCILWSVMCITLYASYNHYVNCLFLTMQTEGL